MNYASDPQSTSSSTYQFEDFWLSKLFLGFQDTDQEIEYDTLTAFAFENLRKCASSRLHTVSESQKNVPWLWFIGILAHKLFPKKQEKEEQTESIF